MLEKWWAIVFRLRNGETTSDRVGEQNRKKHSLVDYISFGVIVRLFFCASRREMKLQFFKATKTKWTKSISWIIWSSQTSVDGQILNGRMSKTCLSFLGGIPTMNANAGIKSNDGAHNDGYHVTRNTLSTSKKGREQKMMQNETPKRINWKHISTTFFILLCAMNRRALRRNEKR